MSISTVHNNSAVHPSIKPRTKDHDVTSKDIDGISDLVVWAPIKEGFIDAFNNVTYESRLRLAAEALHNLRKSAREHEHLEPYADTAKRILSLLDFRIGVVDKDLVGKYPDGEAANTNNAKTIRRPRKYMYLVATFDGPWEPYIRLIYRPLGTFLDLILCNCEGYKPAMRTDFETYAKWVRDNQLDPAIFYSTSGLTVGDKIYLAELEKIFQTKPLVEAESKIARLTLEEPDAAAKRVRKMNTLKALSLGLEALNVLYKLTDLYPPNTKDGEFLSHATADLLDGLDKLLPLLDDPSKPGLKKLKESLRHPLDWFSRELPGLAKRVPNPTFSKGEIQKGILSSYDTADVIVTHGSLLFLKINDSKKLRSFLKLFPWSWEGGTQLSPFPFETEFPIFSNIAFTYQGLQRIGVPEKELAEFPKEFRLGMQERATLIGDKFHNHPRRWRLPQRNWPRDLANSSLPIELNEIDIVIQLRSSIFSTEKTDGGDEFLDFGLSAHDLLETFLERHEVNKIDIASLDDLFFALKGTAETNIDLLITALALWEDSGGFSILGVESMFRPNAFENESENKSRNIAKSADIDHFGFQDGISQPNIIDDEVISPQAEPLDILRGDLIYGYANTRNDRHLPQRRASLLFNGSFMVVRKMAQDVREMRLFESEHGENASALLVGRTKKGKPLVDATNTANTFDYKNDTKGEKCPFSSHIRLANPRSEFHKRRNPKILRRGMTYGKRIDNDAEGERGVIFMAYCASIAEQYEVIQRWLNGANSTGVVSTRNDPLTGARPRLASEPDTFNCLIDGEPSQFSFDKPFVKLEWGSYFFVPSRTALEIIADAQPQAEVSKSDEGLRIIEDLRDWPQSVQQEEWKRLIEDFLTKDPTEHAVTPRVWEAIDAMGGVYEVESGIAFDKGDNQPPQKVILVTDESKILEVLGQGKKDEPSPFSVMEQYKRINNNGEGFGTIYVCLDEGSEYENESKPANDILLRYDRLGAVKSGFEAGESALNVAKRIATTLGHDSFKLELGRQFIHPALANLCKHWYGIPDGFFIWEGTWDWDLNGDRKHAVCPGDFLSTSRHTFYPRPTSRIEEFAKKHGQLVRQQGLDYIKAIWMQDPDRDPIDGIIARKLHKDLRERDEADAGQNTEYYQSLLLRNVIGGMIGAIPPMDSCLRWTLFDWFTEETLWRYQDDYHRLKKINGASGSSKDKFNAALQALQDPLKSAMCVRPAPDLLYRTVTEDGTIIGNIAANKGDMIILCLSAATQKNLRNGSNDVSVVFGGNRKSKTGTEEPGHGLHACPAKDLAIGGMTGILAALLDFGRIKALPASLIVEISDWS